MADLDEASQKQQSATGSMNASEVDIIDYDIITVQGIKSDIRETGQRIALADCSQRSELRGIDPKRFNLSIEEDHK